MLDARGKVKKGVELELHLGKRAAEMAEKCLPK